MIFFKLIIFIFFFLVSNNVFGLPDCADDQFSEPSPSNIADGSITTSEPGNNCNFYIDGEEMPICASLSNPDSRINCINLADLPSCLTLSDPKPLRNCIRIGDGKSNPTAPHDICEIDPNNPSQYDYGKNLDLNCVNLCYTNNPSDGPENCVERKYHHYLYKSPISSEPENLSYLNHRIASRDVSKRNQLQYSCRKLTAGELKYFNDEFSTIDCGKLREIDNNSVRIKRIITDLGPDLQPNTADDQFENIDEKLFSNLNGYVAKNNIADLYKPGEICRYRKCNNEFGINIISSNKIKEQKEKNNSVQISADILENGNYINLKNCSNDPDHSFIAEDKIVCKNDRKCYNFTSDQIEVLVSSPNAVEKCLAKSKNTESIANCFLSLEPLKMCHLHSTIGPDCANTCSNNPNDILGINCFDHNKRPIPMINCNYYSVVDRANYIDDNSVDWNLIPNNYRNKFLQLPDPSNALSNIEVSHIALEAANLAFNSQGKSPDYFKHDICDNINNISECATDCNYVADPNSRINKSCLERFKSESTIVGAQDINPALDHSNQKISNDIHNDANNHWFYRPYPLVDRCTKGQSGDCLDGNRQFRNVVKWSNVSWGSNYNGSLFVFNNGTTPNDLDVSITPRTDRGNLSDKYQREFDNNEIARGAYFHRLCVNWTNMIDLDILDYGEIALKTAAITAAASTVAAPFILVGGPVAVAAVFAITYDRLINEINLDKFISPKQCFAPRINVRTNHLGSSAISGYNGADADNNDREHYESQYDEIDITRNFIETYDPIVTSNDRFKIEFSSENDFDQSNNRIIDDGILKKIILLKDGYIKGGVVHDYSERNVHKYRVRACMRFDGGARSCNTSCNLLGFCHKQNCGYDQCVDLYITDDGKSESIYRCSASIKDGNGWRRKTDEEFRFPEDNYEDEDPNYPGLMKNEEKFCAKEITSREIVTGQSGIIRLRAVAYPDRYICVFADAAHGNGESNDGDEIWRVRGLIPVVSIPYTGLPNLEDGLEPHSSPHPRQFCLRYGMNIDNSSTQVTNNCRENVESNCEPSLQAASDKKENIDNFISDNYPLSDDQKSKHKEYKAAIFNDFQKNLSITSISNQYSKPDDNVYETDFFNPAILVNYGSELATTSLPTGCIGGYEKFNDQVSNTPSSSAHSSIGKGHMAGRSLPSSTLTTASNVVTNYSKCQQRSSYASDIEFPDDTFSHMSFSENRRDIKQSIDGVLQLSANQYSDLTGRNYEKILYLKKGFSQGRPNVGLYKYNGSDTDIFLNQFTIYRKLPNYDNINLSYDSVSGKFSLQLQNKKESDYTTRLPEVELDVDPSDSNSNIESLISGEKCFDLSNDDNKARLEYMKFCLKPDECSNLFDICIENNLFSSVVKGSLWDKCFGDDNNSLINKCGAKWGLNPAIDDDGKRDIMNNMISKIKSYRSHNSNTNLYGWNHEVCLDPKSYNKVKVAAYKAENNMGKCILDPVLNGNASIDDNGTPNNILDDTINLDSGATFNYNSECSDFGGDESVSCHCLKLPTGSDYNLGEKKINFLIDNNHITLDEYYFRDATSRELGLCFDKELPLECLSNKANNYADRTALEDTYHAEYSHVFIPYSEFETGSIVNGECKKNWKVQEGVPMMKCIKDPADSSRGKFENIMLKINFTPSITISGDTTIINLLDANGKKRPELRDIELNMLFPDNILQHAASHNIILNPDSENEEVPIHNIANQNPKIDLTNGSFEIANSNISDTTIINSIAINYSLQGRCVRPKCITDTTSIPVGSHPYYNIKNNEPEGGYYVNDFYSGSNLVDASDNPIDNNLPLKGSKSGYAYWDKNDLNIDAQDLDQTISALSCFDGFETSPNGLPELTCSPEGNINITLIGNNVKNSCIRKECSTPTDLTSTSAIDSNLIEKYFGANFKVFDLNSHPLKASRSTNLNNFDFSVTLKEERSSVTSQCYYNISEGITYVKSSNNAPDPRLACDSAGNIVNLYSTSCIKAGCEAIPDDSAVNLGGGNFVYQGSNYQKPTMASYMTSENLCPSGYVEYPYDIPYKYSDIATLDQATGSLGGVTINDNDIITGGTKPIRSCYITTSDDINNNTTDWQGSDNPCVRGCIGANTFRENFGSNTDSDDIANITSGITHEYRSDCNGQPCNIITINQDLSSTPPKEIIYSNSSKINIKANRNSIYITYPPKHNGHNGPENTKILLFGDSSNFRGIDPSQTPSEISVINRINVGVTTHLVSTDGGKEIKIEWDNTNFNETSYAYFEQEDYHITNNKPHPFYCYDSSGSRINNKGRHCDFYAKSCNDKNGNKRANCGLIKISNFSGIPEGYFESGRNDGKFLLGRKCNNGIWSKIDDSTTNSNPSEAKNSATPLALAKGRFDKEGNEYKKKFTPSQSVDLAVQEGDLLVSKYYNDIEGEDLNITFNGSSANNIIKGFIENNNNYSMASSDNNDKKYSIKLAKFEQRNNQALGFIDTLSLFEIDSSINPKNLGYNINISNNDFNNSGEYTAQSYKLCSKDDIQNRIRYENKQIIINNDARDVYNSAISEGDIFIALNPNNYQYLTATNPDVTFIGNSEQQVAAYHDNGAALLEESQKITLTNQIFHDQYFKGQSIEYNYCREGWDNYPIGSNYPTATCQSDGQWGISGNDNCKKRCNVNNMRFESQEHGQTTRLNINGVMKHDEFFDFIFIMQYKGHNHRIRGKYRCDDGDLNNESGSNMHLGEDDNICNAGVGYGYSYVGGGANTNNHIDNDTYRFYNYKRPDTISYSNIGCDGDSCGWMGDEDDYGHWYNNVDCQRGTNGFRSSMP